MTKADSFFRKKREPNKKPYERPFDEIKSKLELDKIKSEIKRLFFKTTKTKTSILILLRDKFDFNKTEAEVIFYISTKKGSKVKISKKKISG